MGLKICERVANGEFLKRICREPDQPSTITFWSWRNADAVLFASYTRAQEARAELLVDETNDLVETAPTYTDEKGVKRVDGAGVGMLKLKVATRQWTASKLLPKRYGERIELGGTLTHNIVPPDVVLDKVRTMSPLLAGLVRGKN